MVFNHVFITAGQYADKYRVLKMYNSPQGRTMNTKTRLWIIAGAMILALVPTSIAIGLLTGSSSTFLDQLEGHQQVTRTATRLERAVIDAETAQRGYLLTGAPVYLREYADADRTARQAIVEVRAITADGLVAANMVSAMIRSAEAELNLLQQIRTQGRSAALEIVRNQEGRFEAQELRAAVKDLRDAQYATFRSGASDLHRMLKAGQWLAIIGALVGIVTVAISLTILGRYLRYSLGQILTAMRSPDPAGIPADVSARLSGEFRELGETYDAMCARMRHEIANRDQVERRIADLLDRSGSELADRQRASQILSRISNRLPACLDQAELVSLAQRFVPQLFTIRGGALYFLNNSSTVLSRVAQWGNCASSLPEFPPSKCWALRRGQQHHVADVTTDVTCDHLTGDGLEGYVCMPLIAQGETVGLLYLEEGGAPVTANGRGDQASMEDMRVLCENLALALVNLRLRESLRHQSLRDPLTGLHNRRYLEETIDLEFAKSRRSRKPICVILADIDHFKHVNDEFGHDAGDLVLRNVSATLAAHVREGDVACRYGGEEFLILLPDCDRTLAFERAEVLREQIRSLQIRSSDVEIPQITASFGVAMFEGGIETPADVIREADAAMYEAKADGRDRVRPQQPVRVPLLT